MASELADQLLPSITTVEIKPDLLNGADLIAWRADLRLGAEGDTHMPATLVVLNPGDVEMPPPSTVTSRRIPASVGAPPGPPPTPPPAAPPPARGAGSRMPASQTSEPRFGPRFPLSFAARFGSASSREAAQLEAALALSLSTSTAAPPAVDMSESPGVEMSETPAVEMSESPGRAGTSGEEASAVSSTADFFAVSALADFSRESSEILESFNEPLAADAAVDGLADGDESEYRLSAASTEEQARQ